MRILFVSQWFEPEPFFKGLPFVRALSTRGHRVEVLTGFPNYPEGRTYPGYRVRAYQRETLDGITVHRVPLYPSHDSSTLRRIANYATFALAAASIGSATVGPADVAYVYHPPATVALPALVIKLARRIPFVLDVQDLWPDSLAATGLRVGPLVTSLTDFWCRLAYRESSRVIVPSPGFKTVLTGRGVPDAKIEVIYNWCDEAALDTCQRPPGADSWMMSGRFNVTFAGNLGPAQDLQALLRAAALLRERQPSVQILIAGAGVAEGDLRRAVAAEGLDNVRLLGRLPSSEVGWLLRASDALLVLLRNNPLFQITIPSKTQAYLFVGRPVLMGVEGDAADLVRRANAGLCFTPGDAQGMAASVEALMRQTLDQRAELGHAGRRYYLRELALAVGVSRVEAVLQSARRLS